MAAKILAVVFLAVVASAWGSSLISDEDYMDVEVQRVLAGRGFFDGIKNTVSGLVNKTQGAADKIKDTAQNTADKVVDKVTAETKKVVEHVTGILHTINNITNCKCSAGDCQCCRTVKMPEGEACIYMHFKPEDFEVQYGIMWDGNSMIGGKVSGKNPVPFCAPVPSIPGVSLCLKPHDLSLSKDKGFSVCLDAQGRLINKVFANIALNCFSFKNDQISFFKSPTGSQGGLVNLNTPSIDKTFTIPFVPNWMNWFSSS